MSHRVHHFPIRMTHDQARLEQFLNGLDDEVVAILPNVAQLPTNYIDLLSVV